MARTYRWHVVTAFMLSTIAMLSCCAEDPTGRLRPSGDIACDGRCTFDSEAEYCHPTGSLTPCHVYDNSTLCPHDRCRWVPNANGLGVDICALPLSSNFTADTVTYTSFLCEDNNDEIACLGLSQCRWDYTDELCGQVPCGEMLNPQNCSTLPDCIYDGEIFYCHKAGDEIPCPRLWIEDRCDSAPSCEFSAETHQCVYKPVPASSLNCSDFVSADTCPSDRCRFDAEARICLPRDGVAPCMAYRTEQACPTDGTEYEVVGVTSVGTDLPFCARLASECNSSDVYQIQHTATSDRMCADVTTCAPLTEYVYQQPTPTTDTVCAPVSSSCDNVTHVESEGDLYGEVGESAPDDYETDSPLPTFDPRSAYIYAQATASSDIVCRQYSTCTSFEFEKQMPTATTDRECQDKTLCAFPGEYIGMNATATTDRGCSRVSTCRARQYQVESATRFSDRVCDDLTVCEGSDVFESIAPVYVGDVAISDRECGAVSVCTSYQYIEAENTATSDRLCRNITECAEGQIVACPATPYTDTLCVANDTISSEELFDGDGSGGSGDLSLQDMLNDLFGCVTTTVTTSTSTVTTATSSTSETFTSTTTRTSTTTVSSSSTTDLTSTPESTSTTTTDILATTTQTEGDGELTFKFLIAADISEVDEVLFTSGVEDALTAQGIDFLGIFIESGSIIVTVFTSDRQSFDTLSGVVQNGTLLIDYEDQTFVAEVFVSDSTQATSATIVSSTAAADVTTATSMTPTQMPSGSPTASPTRQPTSTPTNAPTTSTTVTTVTTVTSVTSVSTSTLTSTVSLTSSTETELIAVTTTEDEAAFASTSDGSQYGGDLVMYILIAVGVIFLICIAALCAKCYCYKKDPMMDSEDGMPRAVGNPQYAPSSGGGYAYHEGQYINAHAPTQVQETSFQAGPVVPPRSSVGAHAISGQPAYVQTNDAYLTVGGAAEPMQGQAPPVAYAASPRPTKAKVPGPTSFRFTELNDYLDSETLVDDIRSTRVSTTETSTAL